jgi:hypothetical protein
LVNFYLFIHWYSRTSTGAAPPPPPTHCRRTGSLRNHVQGINGIIATRINPKMNVVGVASGTKIVKAEEAFYCCRNRLTYLSHREKKYSEREGKGGSHHHHRCQPRAGVVVPITTTAFCVVFQVDSCNLVQSGS